MNKINVIAMKMFANTYNIRSSRCSIMPCSKDVQYQEGGDISCPSFVSGSSAYGTLTENSDVDLVIRVDGDYVSFMRPLADQEVDKENEDKTFVQAADGSEYERTSLKFGNLNLVCCLSDREYLVWKYGTWQLIGEQPVSRDRGIEVFADWRANLEQKLKEMFHDEQRTEIDLLGP